MEYRSRLHSPTTFTYVVRVVRLGFEKINPFMPRDLLDYCRPDLAHFSKYLWNEASICKIFQGKLYMEFG